MNVCRPMTPASAHQPLQEHPPHGSGTLPLGVLAKHPVPALNIPQHTQYKDRVTLVPVPRPTMKLSP